MTPDIIDKLTYVNDRNRQLYESLYNAGNNRNEAETVLLAKKGIDENLNFFLELMGLICSRRCNIEQRQKDELKNVVFSIFATESIEYCDEIDPEVKKKKLKILDNFRSSEKGEIKKELVGKVECVNNIVEGNEVDKERMRKKFVKCLGNNCPGTSGKVWINELFGSFKYYCLFRALVVEIEKVEKRDLKTRDRIKHRIDTLKKAEELVCAGIAYRPQDVEARIFGARINRKLGYESNLSGEDGKAWYKKAIGRLLEALLLSWQQKEKDIGKENVEITEITDEGEWNSIFLHFRFRALNDLSRVIESWVLSVMRSQIKDNEKALKDLKDAVMEIDHVMTLLGDRKFNKILSKKQAKKVIEKEIAPILKNVTNISGKEPLDKYLMRTSLLFLNRVEDLFDNNIIRTEVLPKDTRVFTSFHNKARILIMLDKKDEAYKYYKKAIGIDNEYAPALENYGMLLLKDGILEEAYRRLSSAQDIYKKHNSLRGEMLDTSLGRIFLEMRRNQEDLVKYLDIKRSITNGTSGDKKSGKENKISREDKIITLRRYNSYTPFLPFKEKEQGGGYFMILDGMGVVIDPGYGFLEALDKLKYSLDDINMIVVSHLHSDHVFQLEEIYALLFERWKRLRKRKEIYVAGKADVIFALKKRFEALEFDINFAEKIRWVMLPELELVEGKNGNTDYQLVYPTRGDVKIKELWQRSKVGGQIKYKSPNRYGFDKCNAQTINDIRNSTNDFNKNKCFKNIRIIATPAFHAEYRKRKNANDNDGKYLASGFLFGNLSKELKSIIGYTGDSGYRECLSNIYKQCDTLILHLGDISLEDFDYFGEISEKKNGQEGYHLNLYGICELLNKLEKNHAVGVISEFGEELGENRIDITKKINDRMMRKRKNVNCFTGDVGLQVLLKKNDSNRMSIEMPCRFCGGSVNRPAYKMNEMLINSNNIGDHVVYYCKNHSSDLLKSRLIQH